MTSNISAAWAISSVITSEGVSGEIAIPAFILRDLILAITSSGLSENRVDRVRCCCEKEEEGKGRESVPVAS